MMEEREYYNDLPGKTPPSAPDASDNSNVISKETSLSAHKPLLTSSSLPQAAPRSVVKKSSISPSTNSKNEQNGLNLIDLNTDIQTPQDAKQTKDETPKVMGNLTHKSEQHQYVNCSLSSDQNEINESLSLNKSGSSTSSSVKDPFDMRKSIHI